MNNQLTNNLTSSLDNLEEPFATRKAGFNSFSEKINGRVAMLGFFIFFFIEVFTKQKLTTFLF